MRSFKINPAAGLGAIALVVLSGVGIVLSLVMLLIQITVGLWHKWPWFSPGADMMGPPDATSPYQNTILGLMAASLLIRLVRRALVGQSVLRELISDVSGVGLSAALSYTVLGTASVWLFTKVSDLGTWALWVWAFLAFLRGWAPGFLTDSGIFAAIYFHRPDVAMWVGLPSAAADVLDDFIVQV